MRKLIVFLDANILFSAAWREDSGLLSLWKTRAIHLTTSDYAVEEAARNLRSPEQNERLQKLLEPIEILGSVVVESGAPWEILLPKKDEPIFWAARSRKADVLLTGDVRHFGRYLGKTVHGVRILRPAAFLAELGRGAE